MGMFDFLLDAFATVAVPEAAPIVDALQGTDAALKAAEIAKTTADAAEAAQLAETAQTANAVNAANAGAVSGLTSGIGSLAPNFGQLAANAGQAVTGAAPATAEATQAAVEAAPAAVQQNAVASGLDQIAPNMGQVNPANYGNAVPGMPSNSPFGSVYAPASPITNAVPDAFNTSAGSFGGVSPSASGASDALSRGFDKAMAWAEKNPIPAAMMAASVANGIFGQQPSGMPSGKYTGPLSKYKLSPNFQGSFATPNVYRAHYAEGGIAALAGGGDTVNFMGGDMYPQSQIPQRSFYATPSQMPTSAQQSMASYEPNTNPLTGEPTAHMAAGGVASIPDVGIVSESDPDFEFTSPYQTAAGRLKKLYKKTDMDMTPPVAAPSLGTINLKPANEKKAAAGGIMGVPSLGGYAAGGNPRLLKGPGDGMSDDIPATIADKQPARLADGEFVVPADVVSHLGNGSTDAGAKKLHTMMDTVRKARTGRKAQGKEINADKYLPK